MKDKMSWAELLEFAKTLTEEQLKKPVEVRINQDEWVCITTARVHHNKLYVTLKDECQKSDLL